MADDSVKQPQTGLYSDSEFKFCEALENGDIKAVQAFLDRGVDLNKALGLFRKYTPLGLAAFNGRLEVVQILLNRGANVNAVGEDSIMGERKAALFAAAEGGNVEVVQVLLNHGADVNIVNKVLDYDIQHQTALFVAAEKGNLEIVQVLLKHGADVNAVNQHDFTKRLTALFAAVGHDNIEIVQALITYGADVNATNEHGSTALFTSPGKEVVQALLAGGIGVNTINEDGRTALFAVAANGNVEVVQILLNHGADVNIADNSGQTALFAAAANGNVEVVEALLSHVLMYRMNVRDQLGQTPLVAAVKSGKLEIVQAFINYGINVNITGEQGRTALFYAVKSQDLNIIKILLEHGANPSEVDSTGSSVLHYTANNFRYYFNISSEKVIEIIKLLLSFGASADMPNSAGETLLLHYLSYSRTEKLERNLVYAMATVCCFLIRKRVDVNVRSNSGHSVIHLVLLLLRDILQDNSQFLLIFYKCVTSKVQIAETLSRLICSIFSTPSCSKSMTSSRDDIDGNTPLHLWASLPHPSEESTNDDSTKSCESILIDMAVQLLSHGAQLNAPNGKGETPLHMAQTWAAAKFLIERGALPNATDSDGNTPLLKQVEENQKRRIYFGDVNMMEVDTVELKWKELLSFGMDPWKANNKGKTVLSSMLGWYYFSSSHIQAFLKATGAPYGLEFPLDSNGDTPLHVICNLSTFQQHTLAKRLIPLTDSLVRSVSQLVNWKNRKGETALHIACRVGSDVDSYLSEIIPKLRAYGAQVDIADAEGKTCFDIAEEKPKVMELLTEEVQLFEVDPCLPWSPMSVSHNEKLAQVAGGQNVRRTRSLHYHNEAIGSGAFGQVYAGLDSKDGREVALKRVEKERLSQSEDRREIKHLVKLANCDNVVCYLSYHTDQDFLYIILELMEGSVEELLDGSVQKEELQSLGKDVMRGLNYLHENNVIHRDIKSSNILYKRNPNLCLKLADFGLSGKALTTGSKQSTTVMHSKAGTRCWMAPELLKGTMQHSEASDVFACGLVLHYLLSGKKHPFGPTNLAEESVIVVESKIVENILNKKLEIDGNLSPEATDLVKLMVNHNKDDRPLAAEALKHPLFWSNDKKTRFLCAVANQPEVERPRLLVFPLSPVEHDLEHALNPQFIVNPWNGKVPQIYAEMTKSKRSRKYDTSSAVDLLRFVRNTLAHITNELPTNALRESVLTDHVFLLEFPTLVMVVYKAVKSHGWSGREEIKAAIAST